MRAPLNAPIYTNEFKRLNPAIRTRFCCACACIQTRGFAHPACDEKGRKSMSRIGSWSCVALLCAAAFAPSAGAQPAPKNYPALFDALWTTVDDNFYDPSFHGLDWKAIGARYRAQLAGVSDDRRFLALATKMVGELGVSHLNIVPPSTSSAYRFGIGVRLRDLDGQRIVSDITPLADARAQGLHVGDRLVSPDDAVRGALGTVAQLRFESCERKTRAVTAARVGAFWPPRHPDFEWSRTDFGQGRTIGYIRIGRFDDGAAELADRAMAELKDTSAIVIDLRGNTGGNLSGMRLASYFEDKRFAAALLSRFYLKPLGHPVTKADIDAAAHVSGAYTDAAVLGAVRDNKGAAVFVSEDLGARRYTKPVAVLIGPETASAAEGFAWEMRLATKAVLVGAPSQGYLLSAEEFPLPGGWTVTVPTQGVWDGDATDYRDKPVPVDVAVAWTRADLCAGRDPDIAKALALLKARN
jgi:carboxyl-terminal processing protease